MFGVPQACYCRGGVRLAALQRAPAGRKPAAMNYGSRLHRMRAFFNSDLDVPAEGNVFKEEFTPEEEEALRKNATIGGMGSDLRGAGEKIGASGLLVKEVQPGEEIPGVSDEDPWKPAPVESDDSNDEPFPYEVGDNVMCTVLGASDRGCKVAIGNTGFQGWCMARDFPFMIMEGPDGTSRMRPQDGLLREFKVIAVPEDCRPGGKGPLMSAKAIDKPILYRRVEQIYETCKNDFEAIEALCLAANQGGVVAVACGASAFLPRSQCVKEIDRFYNNDELNEKYRGKKVLVSVVAFDEEKNRVVLSETRASEYESLKNIQPGSLVWGKVTSLQEWGAFILIDRTNVHCLLHISNISQTKVPTIHDVFEVGDVVCAVIVSMEEDYKRISVSTADLEEESGDMLLDKQKVYEHAPIAVAQIQKEIDAQRADYSEE